MRLAVSKLRGNCVKRCRLDQDIVSGSMSVGREVERSRPLPGRNTTAEAVKRLAACPVATAGVELRGRAS